MIDIWLVVFVDSIADPVMSLGLGALAFWSLLYNYHHRGQP